MRNATDVIEALIAPVSTIAAQAALPLGKTAITAAPPSDTTLIKKILGCLGPTPIAEDQLLRDIRLQADIAAPVLVDLELDGRITRHPGGLLSRAV